MLLIDNWRKCFSLPWHNPSAICQYFQGVLQDPSTELQLIQKQCNIKTILTDFTSRRAKDHFNIRTIEYNN